MTEHIQPLLERIRTEGLQQAQQEREALLAEARAEASEIVAKAEAAAVSLREAAEKDAAAMQARTETALAQSARDTLLSFRSALNGQLETAAKAAAGAAMASGALVAELLKALVAAGGDPSRLEGDAETADRVKALLPALLKDAGRGDGVEVVVNPKIKAGFRLRFVEGAAEADVTDEAVAKWLAAYLRPEVARLLRPEEEA